ncbi:cytoplasmic phosphatidylinositol transfer protein 1-like [Carcharodon carcharias]|uniref:cytoplasmic phosphatidylinositol transfer protein 1-like n=1 Tax=Carcharodon carcharias TaxID=13397 RepID=UPI001B7DEC40|nr:cytoplasmic phosphatidylinositol transfer protein 1-like [Carcharodon carcharias]
MLVKEYRTCMPLTVEEYRVGQLYMINRHSDQESGGADGVEVITNQPHTDPQHGVGQFTQKNIYLNSKLPQWVKAFVPNIFYIREKAWNYYPYTVTEYTCSFLPKLSIRIQTRFEDNNGSNNNVFYGEASPTEDVSFIDILSDIYPERYYKESEDPSRFQSVRTGRGPLTAGWRETSVPIMCSYKLVAVKFEVYGLQTRVEQLVHKNIRDILLVGHRQAFAWIDEWIDMSVETVREYERELQQQTNQKISSAGLSGQIISTKPVFYPGEAFFARKQQNTELSCSRLRVNLLLPSRSGPAQRWCDIAGIEELAKG